MSLCVCVRACVRACDGVCVCQSSVHTDASMCVSVSVVCACVTVPRARWECECISVKMREQPAKKQMRNQKLVIGYYSKTCLDDSNRLKIKSVQLCFYRSELQRYVRLTHLPEHARRVHVTHTHTHTHTHTLTHTNTDTDTRRRLTHADTLTQHSDITHTHTHARARARAYTHTHTLTRWPAAFVAVVSLSHCGVGLS